MSYSKEDIFEHDNDEDNYTNALDNSDVDEIADEMKLICTTESDEYR